MTTLVNPALGRAATGFTMAACTVNSSGVITVGTVKTFTGQLTEFDMNEANETENISASTSRNANEVIVETQNTATVSGFLFANDVYSSSSTNPIFFIAQTADYIQMVGSWAGRSFTFYGVIKSYKETIGGKGKINFTMEVGFPDIGSANPLFA